MLSCNLINPWLCATIFGVLSHLFYFRNAEHHKQSFLYLKISLFLPCAVILGLCTLANFTLFASFKLVFQLEILYLVSTFASIAIYRCSPVHRLYKFPGPFFWRASKLTHAYKNRDLYGFRHLDSLHKEFGEYVRTGPSELSITDPDSVIAIHGSSSKCIRSAWYEMGDPLRSIFETRSKSEHERRRRIWDQGFSVRSLQAYEPRIESHVNQLIHQIKVKSKAAESVNASIWFNYFSFDVMGDVAFGKGFGLLESGAKLSVLKMLENGQKGLGVFGSVPWLFMILTKLPWIKKEYDVFLNWCEKQMLDRRERKAEFPDIMSHLFSGDPMTSDTTEAHRWLTGDSRIVIVAGSDAVASSLAFAFYYLAQDVSRANSIRKELIELEKTSDLSAKALQTKAEYLNAFITEVLRLWPPNPSGFLRQTPKEGLKIGEKYIPGDVTLCTPLWTLHRSPKCFRDPLEFIPERWTSQSELVIRKDAYVPFSCGPYGCVGKQLALMEMRIAIARIVMEFDVEFASGEGGERLLADSKDWFTIGLADLMIAFRPREL